jgi:2-oxoglutarate dehydrogenase E2 component (dihydrolipoamide succinyltransferase)
MRIELKVPDVGESVREVQIGRWLKREGDSVERDENLVELETDKASLELPAPAAGVMGKILKREGDVVAVGDMIGYVEQDGAAPRDKAAAPHNNSTREPTHDDAAKAARQTDRPLEATLPQTKTAGVKADRPSRAVASTEAKSGQRTDDVPVTPAARRALRDHGMTAADVEASGPRIDRDDVLRRVKEKDEQARVGDTDKREAIPKESKTEIEPANGELEEIVPMSLIRRRIAERLVRAQQQAALLTTFNEIEMTAVKQLRDAYRESFQKKYGVKLGIMSFFVKAVVDALKQQAVLNAEIRDGQIVYRRYYHIGIAISSAKGLVVPVLRFAERLSFAEIEQAIDDFARRAAINKLGPQELEGGTFTITNGGIYGSLLSTPIVNPPQSGVLGMHAIQDRPIAHAGQAVIRPMMYVALTYDHRLVDGRESVTFLKRIKDAIEDPARMLLEV